MVSSSKLQSSTEKIIILGREYGNSEQITKILCIAGASSTSGALTAFAVSPMDVVKVRLQVHGVPRHATDSVIAHSVKTLLREQGIGGFYLGLSTRMLALVPNWAVYFTVYEVAKSSLLLHGNGSEKLSPGQHIMASAIGGAAQAFATNPLWVVATRIQTQGMRDGIEPYKNPFYALRTIAQTEGIRGLYSGLLPSLFGITHVMIQFPLYEQIKEHLAERGNTTTDNLSIANTAIASSMSKTIASTLTYPHEVVRSKLHEQGYLSEARQPYKNVLDCVKKVYKNEGVPGFYRGCFLNFFRTTPAAVITLTSYEMVNRFLQGKFSK